MTRRTRRATLLALALISTVLAAGGVALAATVGSHRAPGLGAGQIERIVGSPSSGSARVIVLLRDEHGTLPADRAHVAARTRALATDQRPLERSVQAAGGTVHASFHTVNAFAATVSAAERTRLDRDPAVAQVMPDVLVSDPDPTGGEVDSDAPRSRAHATAPAAGSSVTTQLPDGQQVCPAPGAPPLVEPEGLSLIKDPQARALGVDGSGVTVAFFAEGVDVGNPDLTRSDGRPVITDLRDFTGEGPNAQSTGGEAFGDASTIAAQGRVTYDLSKFVAPAHSLPAGCDIRLEGVAPGASLAAMKVFGLNASAYTSVIVQAMDWAVSQDHVNVLNESFGGNPLPDSDVDLTKAFNDMAVASGVTVTASSGDQGTANTIGSPASDPNVLDVGATTQFQGVAQTIRGGYQLTNAGWTNDNIAEFSSGGFTQSGFTIDLVAPGNESFEACTPDPSRFSDCTNRQLAPSNLSTFGGTSESAPMTAGVAALVIQAYRHTHGGATPAPALVKQIITSNADDLDIPSDEQGAGELDALAAVQAAETVDGGPAIGTGRLVSPSQLDLATPAGARATGSVSVTDDGAVPETYTSTLRTLGPTLTTHDGAIDLTPAKDPTFVDDAGHPQGYQTVRFTVPQGAQRIDAALAHPGGNRTVNMVLVDPSGSYAAYTYHPPRDNAAFAHIDVRDPPPGIWTAELFTPVSGGYTGTVHYAISTSRFVSAGTVSPASVTLDPGQTATIRVALPAPRSPGDLSRDLAITDSSGDTSVVPIVLRSLVGLRDGTGAFSGAITGGDGDGPLAREDTFAFDVPRGAPELGVHLTLPDDPGTVILGFLVSPGGQAVAQEGAIAPDGPESLQLLTHRPQAGRWRLLLATGNPIGGTAVSGAFHATVSIAPYPVRATGVPRGGTIRAGRTVTATVRVHNPGPVPLAVFADPRTDRSRLVTLVGGETASLPISSTVASPTFGVPTETSRLTAAARGSAPVQFDWGAGAVTEGDPDLGSTTRGDDAFATFAGPEIAPGPWFMTPALRGPFATQASGRVRVGMAALIRGFDASVTSSTGDPQLADVLARPPVSAPVLVAPGATGLITVRFTAHGPTGSVDRGELYLDDDTSPRVVGSSAAQPVTANVLAAIAYRYRVG